MGSHIINGKFQSDKYPTCPPGKVPLSVEDPAAQDLLWQYAQRRRSVDHEFSDDLEFSLKTAGHVAPYATHVYIAHRLTSPDRDANIEAAGRLMAALADRLPIVPHCSWITLARYWDESKREKGLAIDLAQIARCDELWLTGPEVSSGMRVESEGANAARVPQFNYVGLTVDEIVDQWERRRAGILVR